MSNIKDRTTRRVETAAHAMTVLRNKLVAGVLVAIPLVVTIWVLNIAYKSINNISAPFLRRMGLDWPLLGFIVTLLLLLGLGLMATHVLGKKILSAFEQLLLRVPIVATVYGAVKQVIDSFNTYSNVGTFKRVVYLEYPAPGCKLLGFSTGHFFDEVLGEEVTSVILPTSPNPMTGLLILVPSSRITVANMTLEQATKLIVSAGLVVPKHLAGERTETEQELALERQYSPAER